jgi:hypothetical protein
MDPTHILMPTRKELVHNPAFAGCTIKHWVSLSFIAHKSASRLVVEIHSDSLISELIHVIGLEQIAEEDSVGQDDTPKSWNGFTLL